MFLGGEVNSAVSRELLKISEGSSMVQKAIKA